MQNLPTTQNLPIQSPPVQRGRVRRGAENVSLGGITSSNCPWDHAISIGSVPNEGSVIPSIMGIGKFNDFPIPFASDDAE
jgi:hypothetical protein